MRFLKKLGQTISAIFKIALPILIAVKFPEAMANVATGAVVKHGTPIPNNNIPVLNAIVSVGVAYLRYGINTGDWHGAFAPALQDGLTWMMASTALHQSVKLPLGEIITGDLARRVGPGPKFSI